MVRTETPMIEELAIERGGMVGRIDLIRGIFCHIDCHVYCDRAEFRSMTHWDAVSDIFEVKDLRILWIMLFGLDETVVTCSRRLATD